MIFTSSEFLLFLLIAIALFYFMTSLGQRVLLLVANYVFYMWMKPAFGLLLLAGTIVTYFAARAIQNRVLGLRRTWMVAGIVLMLGQLVLFKYADFFLSGLGWILSWESSPELGLLLPIGISFYSFAAAGYLAKTRPQLSARALLLAAVSSSDISPKSPLKYLLKHSAKYSRVSGSSSAGKK